MRSCASRSTTERQANPTLVGQRGGATTWPLLSGKHSTVTERFYRTDLSPKPA